MGALDEEKIRRMHQICQMEKTVAVGEIGLDYYWDKENHEKQIYWFERQLEVAREEKLPFIIHSRDAAKDTLDTMKRLHAGDIGGAVHCFSYGKEMAREYLEMCIRDRFLNRMKNGEIGRWKGTFIFGGTVGVSLLAIYLQGDGSRAQNYQLILFESAALFFFFLIFQKWKRPFLLLVPALVCLVLINHVVNGKAGNLVQKEDCLLYTSRCV